MELFKKYVTCILTFFIPFIWVTLCEFYSSPLLCYLLKITNYGLRKRIFFVYMDDSAYRVLSKEVDNRIFRPNRILGTCMYKQPYWQSSEIIIIFVQLSIVISDTLMFLDVFSLLFGVILSEFHEKPRGKDWVTEKVHRRKMICRFKLNMYIFFYQMWCVARFRTICTIKKT